MPADFIINVEHRVVFSSGSGVFTPADFIEHMSRLRSASEFKPDFDQIVDCRGITFMDLNSDQVRELAGQSIFSSQSRRALVVSSDLHFGLSRIFSAYRDANAGQAVAVFRSMHQALEWLNLPVELISSTSNETDSAAASA